MPESFLNYQGIHFLKVKKNIKILAIPFYIKKTILGKHCGIVFTNFPLFNQHENNIQKHWVYVMGKSDGMERID